MRTKIAACLLISVLIAVIAVMTVGTAAADPPDTSDSVFVEIYDIQRWDNTYAAEAAQGTLTQWTQYDDDGRTYRCGWQSGQSSVCEDQADGALYVCTLYNNGTDNGRISCQHAGGGAALAPASRQQMANTLSQGIANRGQITNAPCERSLG